MARAWCSSGLLRGCSSNDPPASARDEIDTQGDDMNSLHALWAGRLSGRGLATLILMAGAAPAAIAQSPASCEALAGMAIPASAIALPTMGGSVLNATVVPAAGAGAAFVAEHCRVNGRI